MKEAGAGMLKGRGRISFFPPVLYHSVAAGELVILTTSESVYFLTLCV